MLFKNHGSCSTKLQWLTVVGARLRTSSTKLDEEDLSNHQRSSIFGSQAAIVRAGPYVHPVRGERERERERERVWGDEPPPRKVSPWDNFDAFNTRYCFI